MKINKQIRQEVAQLLKSAKHENGALVFNALNVYSHRIAGFGENEDEFPAASVFFETGEVNPEHGSDNHVTKLTIQLFATAPIDIDGALDDLSDPVIKTMEDNPDLNGLVESCQLSGYDYVTESTATLGLMELEFDVIFDN